ncbi:MAG: hypothetical protein QW315_06220 [Candidatus Hadarchaeum sp.]
MRRYPYTVLVCLIFLFFWKNAYSYQSDNFINVNITPFKPALGTLNTSDQQISSDSDLVSYVPASGKYPLAVGTPYTSTGKPITKCKPQETAPCLPILPLPKCILPQRFPGMFELSVQVFWAKVSGTVRWPAMVLGVPASDVNINDDLGIPKHNTLLEYSARYQFRPHWALFYSIMPISLEGSTNLPRTIYYGQFIYPAGTRVNTKWDFIYQRVGLLYQPIVSCNATVSVYASWLFNDQKQSVRNEICGGTCCTISRTRHMVMAGVELQKCIRTLCNGATLSCDTKVGLGFLDGTFGLDVQTGLQFSVPMNSGRWGYAKGGYRLINFTEDRNDLRLDALFEGGFAELGMIF